MSDMLIISDYNILLTLHKAIIEAKFSENPIHMELPGSHLLAQVSNQIVEILIKKEIESGGYSAINWKRWREIDEHRREWDIAMKYIVSHGQVWRTWERDRKEEFVRVLLSPYIISSELLDRFIIEADTAINNNSVS